MSLRRGSAGTRSRAEHTRGACVSSAGSGTSAGSRPTAGTVTGTVEAPDLDAPLAGATVTIVGTKITATTDDEGHYTLDAPPGVTHVRADFAGFSSEERVVNVAAGASAKLDFALATAPVLTRRSSRSVRARRARTSTRRSPST